MKKILKIDYLRRKLKVISSNSWHSAQPKLLVAKEIE
jgi:hypothetical protein